MPRTSSGISRRKPPIRSRRWGEGVELTDTELDTVAGGWLFQNEKGEWEVININGDVRFTSDFDTAYAWAEKRGYSTRILSWRELNQIRTGYTH